MCKQVLKKMYPTLFCALHSFSHVWVTSNVSMSKVKLHYKRICLSFNNSNCALCLSGPCLSALSLKNCSGFSSLYVHSFAIYVWNVHKAIHFALGHRRNVTCQIQFKME